MLDLPRYLLGVAETILLIGFSLLAARTVRTWLLPRISSAPACLATGVLALALLIWVAEFLGSFGWFEAAPYVTLVGVVGVGTWALGRGLWRRDGVPSLPYALLRAKGRRASQDEALPSAAFGRRKTPHPDTTRGRGVYLLSLIAMAIATAAAIHFATGVRLRLSTGMTGFDSTWYHGPFAAGFFQSGSTWDLHFIAPQFLAWFYPANAEIFQGAGMLAFDRDLLSPLLNLGWFLGCLLALWCVGRPYGVAPWSLALGAVALSVPALSDQAGEARNDIVGIFFLLAAVAIALNARGVKERSAQEAADDSPTGTELSPGALAIVGLAAGLAAGTKLNFLLPAAVLVAGLAVVAPRGARWRALWASGLAALAGGGYWYLRNLAHSGNPLPWFDHLGPTSLPAPDQALGGREGHSVLGYLTDGSVWSDWFLPGLHHGLSVLWPLLLLAAAAGLALAVAAGFYHRSESGEALGSRALAVAGLAGVAAALAWLVAPTSASGPDGIPRGFESGLRYLTPALILGLALLPAALKLLGIELPAWLRSAGVGHPPNGRILKMPASLGRHLSGRGVPHTHTRATALCAALIVAIAIGYPIQRHYLENRYANPTFADAPGLNAAFRWANSISGARIATTSTRQYPLFGRDLSNHVQYVGEERPHGGFTAPTTCHQWIRLLEKGHYDYVVTTRDRTEPGKSPYPPTAKWTNGPWAEPVLAIPPTVVYKLKGTPDPTTCP